ncbi:MAG: hypothetical protein K2K31_02935 [Clostridia bacterium]|nr:hypothetical protein [Clostridia bacterium]
MFNENKKWFKTILKLNRKGKLEEPYRSLFCYYRDITCEKENLLWKHASLSHFLFFQNCEFNENLDEISFQLSQILPPALKDNFENALEKYKKITDFDDVDANFDMFEGEDDFADDNAEDMRKILIDYVDDLKYKK